MRKTMTTILVVEDEPVVRNFVVKVLATENYRVFEADNAAEALEVSERFEQIDLIITDHALKTMTGRELAEHPCVSRPNLKVLQISGYPMEYLVREGLMTLNTPFLGKPFVRTQLLAAVDQLLRQTQLDTSR